MTREEAKETLLCLYDAVDEEGVIDTHTWYKGIQDNIRESLSMAIEALDQEPCDDAISREDVEECKELMTDINGDTVYAVRMSDIRQLPPVTPQPKTGHWIEHPEIETSTPEYLMFYECSECGNKQCFYKEDTHRRNYCGKCGCRMVEPQESEEINGNR